MNNLNFLWNPLALRERMSVCGPAKRATVHCVTQCAAASSSPVPPPSAPAFCAGVVGPKGNISSVPFFMYDTSSMPSFSACNRSEHLGKYSSSLLLVDALEQHPWRVRDMSSACVFVVPALVDWMAEGLCASISDDEHLKLVASIVRPHLHRGRHIFLAASWPQVWRYGNRTAASCLHRLLPGILQAHFRHEPPCHVGIGFVADADLANPLAPWRRARASTGLPPRHFLTPSVTSPRPFEIEFSLGCRPGHPYRDRQRFLYASTHLDNRSIVVTMTIMPLVSLRAGPVLFNRSELPRCHGDSLHYCRRELSPTDMLRLRKRSEFTLFMRGDDESSDRIQNAFSMLQIPLIVGEKNVYWLPFPHAIPWREIIQIVPQAAFERDPTRAVAEAAAALSSEERLRRRSIMLAHLPDLLWTASESRVATNFLREIALVKHAKCWR
jgi:hypothetical protein